MSTTTGHTIKEAARLMNISEKTVRRRVLAGHLKAEKIDSVYGPTFVITELPEEYREKIAAELTIGEEVRIVGGMVQRAITRLEKLQKRLEKSGKGNGDGGSPRRQVKARLERIQFAKHLIARSPGIKAVQVLAATKEKYGVGIRSVDLSALMKK